MPFNTNDFRSRVDKSFNSPAHFEVIFTADAPVLQSSDVNIYGELFKFSAYKVELGDRHVENIQRNVAAPAARIPYGVSYSTISISFIENKDNYIRYYFDAWLDSIFKSNSSYNVAYYDDIIVPKVVVKMYGRDGKVKTNQKFYDVFPLNIGSTTLSWEATNQILTTTVELAFRESQFDIGEIGV